MTDSRSRRLLLVIAYIGFISLGLPDPLIGVAWPWVRRDFGLPVDSVALVFFGFGLSYFLSSFFTGRLLKSWGIGTLLAVSSAFVAFGGFGFASAPLWFAFAASSLLHGLGSGAIDAGLNHYVAHHFSARHMNWLHACYSLGATFGPLIMTAMITWQNSWRLGYATVASILLILSILFVLTRRLWDQSPEIAASDSPTELDIPLREVLRRGVVWLHILLFFIYVGLEIMVGQWSYSILTEARAVPKETAGLWVTMYWAGIGVGRLLLGFVVDRLGIDRILRFSMFTAVVGAAIFMANISTFMSSLALALMGLGLASIFPSLMTRTPQRLGKAAAAHAIGFQVSAGMLGGAVIPSAAGVLGQSFGLEAISLAAVTLALALALLHEALIFSSRRTRSANPPP